MIVLVDERFDAVVRWKVEFFMEGFFGGVWVMSLGMMGFDEL